MKQTLIYWAAYYIKIDIEKSRNQNYKDRKRRLKVEINLYRESENLNSFPLMLAVDTQIAVDPESPSILRPRIAAGPPSPNRRRSSVPESPLFLRPRIAVTILVTGEP